MGGNHIWHLITDCTQSHVTQYRTEVLRPHAVALASRLVDLLIMAHPPGEAGANSAPGRPVPTRKLPEQLTLAAEALRAAVQPATHPTWWDTADAQALLYRLLICAPISAFDVRRKHPDLVAAVGAGRRPPLNRNPNPAAMAAPEPDDGMPALLAFARALDATVLPNSKLRPWANTWTAWSVQHILGLAGVHRCGQSEVEDTTDRHVPCPLCSSRASPVVDNPVPDLINGAPNFGEAAPAPGAAPPGAIGTT